MFHANGDNNPRNILPKKRKTDKNNVGRATIITEPSTKAQKVKDNV